MNEFKDEVTDHLCLRFLEGDKLLRTIDGANENDFNSEAIGCFLYIASHEGCHKQAMEQVLNMTSTSGSRNTDLLSEHHWRKYQDGKPFPSLNLIIKKEDPSHRRRQILYLSIKGKKLIKDFKSIIYGDNQ